MSAKQVVAPIRIAGSFVWKIIWKVATVFVAIFLGAFGANQAGWSGAELVVNARSMALMDGLVTGFFAFLGAAMAIGTVILVHRIAKPALWLMVPILLYAALVMGIWNGILGDFDATRMEAIRHHLANAYALEHMSARARLLSCKDTRIELTDDAKEVCAREMNAVSGEIGK